MSLFTECGARSQTECGYSPGETCQCWKLPAAHTGRHCCRCGNLWSTTTGMVRRTDPETSQAAAADVWVGLNEKQAAVLEAFETHGPMSGRQVERVPEIAHWAASTARRRVTDLRRMHLIEACGEERLLGRTAATVYRRVAA